MTGDKIEYKYVDREAPAKKINYSYSKFAGEAFLQAWSDSRKQFTTEGPVTFSPDLSKYSGTETGILFISWINNEAIDWPAVKLLVKRFEVTKKIYIAYDENFRPTDRTAFHEPELYVLFAFLLTSLYERTEKLYFLNALLKCNDIGCGLFDRMTSSERELLGYCIQKEKHYIQSLRHSLQ